MSIEIYLLIAVVVSTLISSLLEKAINPIGLLSWAQVRQTCLTTTLALLWPIVLLLLFIAIVADLHIRLTNSR